MDSVLPGQLQSVKLPFPPNDLSPNKRQHWSALARAKKAYKRDCHYTCLEQKIRKMPEAKILVEMTFIPPANYKYDQDNLIARMKSGLDALSDYIGVDDSYFQLTAPVIAKAQKSAGVKVVLRPIT